MKSIYILLLLLHSTLFAQVTDFSAIDFTKANIIAERHKGAALNNLPLLSHKLTANLSSEVEKFRAIYMWICQNIKGDHALDKKVNFTIRKLKNDSIARKSWNDAYRKIAFKKLVKQKKTMCTGYAYLLKTLCDYANIECVIINGYSRSVDANTKKLDIVNHSWNAVKINNKWYLCDATWSSGYLDEYSSFVTEYNDGYFLADPAIFNRNHYPINEKWLLETPITKTRFIAAPLIYGETFKHNVLPVRPMIMDLSIQKNDIVHFEFKTKTKLKENDIALVYYPALEEKKFHIQNLKNENGTVSFEYQFKSKGFYDTHLRIKGDIVATYTIKVKNVVVP